MQGQRQSLDQPPLGESVISIDPPNVLVSWTDNHGAHAPVTVPVFISQVNPHTTTVLNVGPAASAGSAKATSIFGLFLLDKLEVLNVAGNSIAYANISQNDKLTALNLSNNRLTVNAVNWALWWMMQLTTEPTGPIDVSGQSPAAPPSQGPPSGIAARNVMLISGWDVITD